MRQTALLCFHDTGLSFRTSMRILIQMNLYQYDSYGYHVNSPMEESTQTKTNISLSVLINP